MVLCKQKLRNTALNQQSTILFIFLGLIIKYFTTGGFYFNSQLWDFERDMFEQLHGQGFLSFVLIRDPVGYPIIPMQSAIYVIGSVFDGPLRPITLRFCVLVIQVFSFHFAVKLLPNYVSISSRRFAFLILLLTPIEDVNYIHHVGYLLLFPQLYFVRLIDSSNVRKNIFYISITIFLLNKPITAVLLILYVLIRLNRKNIIQLKSMISHFVVITSSSLYLLVYMLLPRTLEMPIVLPLNQAHRIVADIPFLASAIIFPAISLGLLGAIKLLPATSLIGVIGLLITMLTATILILWIWKFVFKVKVIRQEERQESFEILLMFIISYVLVFSIGNFYWVTVFPLWDLAYPSHIWMRWSSVPAVFFVLLLISAFDLAYSKSTLNLFSRNLALNKLILCGVVMQYFLLWFFGYSYLQRWWGQ